ncbi:hypothetical protein [Pseudomonas asplenii]|uniref:Uncharacterized protein n=1 Tax=Pseudomonas asplenii TaxID=53407 RepID=A0A1H6PAH3_9PSED|nr:hypothetical protein [Pseudomonas fuscovaginae]SEI21720.1 hypothetical protein SAMN05216581_4600 [Pseudomonas fuscovaginae]
MSTALCGDSFDAEAEAQVQILTLDACSVSEVAILDYGEELLPDGIEVSILGIPAAFYEQLFPDHVIKYTHQFAN